jgi:hypothetical protein
MSAVVTLTEAPGVARAERRGPAPPDGTLDLLTGIVGLVLAAGFLLDNWAHLHIPIETFFTPYHAVFYSAMVAGTVILALTARRNHKLGYRGGDVLPAAYQSALWGVPVFFAGGIGDLIWHTFFGVEDRIEAVTSPTHLIIGLGVLLVTGAPIRSALEQRASLRSLRAQLPLIFALATWLEFIHLGTAYGYDPGAARMYAPPQAAAYGVDYFTNTALLLFHEGTGMAVIIVQSLVMMGVAVWLVARFALRPGALALLFVLGNGMIAAALGEGTPFLATILAMCVAAGLTGDLIVARAHPGPDRPVAFGLFGAIVPGVYYGTYFLVTALTGGFWWSWALTLGAVVWSMLCGLALTLIAGNSAPRTAAPK